MSYVSAIWSLTIHLSQWAIACGHMYYILHSAGNSSGTGSTVGIARIGNAWKLTRQLRKFVALCRLSVGKLEPGYKARKYINQL